MEHTKLFDGTLGVYPCRKFHIDLVPGPIAKHARSYPVPVIHLSAFKRGSLHLVEIGILSPKGASEWASPTFTKNGTVCWVSDLRELSKVVKQKQYMFEFICFKQYEFIPTCLNSYVLKSMNSYHLTP
jgi:hypothetical protein